MMTATPGLDLPTAGSFPGGGLPALGGQRAAGPLASCTLLMICGRFWPQSPLSMLGGGLLDVALRRLLLLSMDGILFCFNFINFFGFTSPLRAQCPVLFLATTKSRLRSPVQA